MPRELRDQQPVTTPEYLVATRTVPARTLWIVLVVVLVLGSVAIGVLLRSAQAPNQRARPTLVGLSPESTATVGYAGAIPSFDEAPLPRPLGLDGDADRLYVALADAAAVAVFGFDGTLEETLPVATAEGAARATPVDLALLSDGRLAVVDTAGRRVLVVDPRDPNSRGEEFTGGIGAGRISNPTAIEAAGGSIYVADASDGSVSEYSEAGVLLRSVTFERPLPAFIGGLSVSGDALWVSDSNAGRVISVDLRTARQTSVLPRELALPRGIAVTDEGEVMVAETFGRRVSVSGPEGELLTTFPDATTESVGEEGLLMAPESLFWDDRASRLYVSDVTDGRIKVYNYRERE